MQIYDRIKQDHDHARALLKELKEGEKLAADKRAALFDELKREIWVHAKVEETVFYLPLIDKRKTRAESLEALNEHHIANSLLEEMDTIPQDNDMWASKMGVLKETLEHHMKEEEDEVFGEARKVLSREQATAMAEDFDRRKRLGLQAITP